MARPTKYDDERAKRIADLLRAGNTRKTSAEAGGICFDTFSTWIERFPGFSAAVSRAEAEAEALHVTTIMKAAREGDWRASESWLKRRRRADWGDTIKAEVTGSDGGPILQQFVGDTNRIYGNSEPISDASDQGAG